MDCPFCGKEMKEGRIPSRDHLKWYDNTADTVMGEGVRLSESFKDTQAFYCPGCRQIVLPVPEVEGILEKMERKLNAAGEKIEAVREQWEARRTQNKQQKRKENFGKKDPWEL